MHTIYILSLLCVLALLARSAPLQKCSGKIGLPMENSEFQKTVKNCSSLVYKVQCDIPEVKKSWALSLDSSAPNLEYIVSTLGIPPSPTLMALSADFDMELCLNRMYEGLQLYQDLLSAIRDRISNPEKVTDLLIDIRDLLTHVLKMQELAQLKQGVQYGGSGLSSRLTKEYEVQVAADVVLSQLLSFSQDVYRSLRNIGLAKSAARC
ncbi:granulocyte colony-stimulating factor-like [Anguilla anguilla]|nr:granulocyte colony-stimulating factor-like [Anguilla anguilla]